MTFTIHYPSENRGFHLAREGVLVPIDWRKFVESAPACRWAPIDWRTRVVPQGYAAGGARGALWWPRGAAFEPSSNTETDGTQCDECGTFA